MTDSTGRTVALSSDGQLWARLSALHARVGGAMQKVLQRRADIGFSEFLALVALANSELGELHMQELEDVTQLNQSSVSRLVLRLERTGLTERRHCERDRRRVYTGITPLGREVLAEALPVYEAALSDAFGHVTGDRELGPLLAKLRD
ncbi:MarR family winged helix-turn-helix transcriptional regulator [Saccharothrix variisporea]|uniref:DNA-binding MarR family transcriptional regulator n=1 Tax=Saccharothrix variisporea TaxID=543527 RepID=A0A495XIN5_9PSEU|nr:MarR family transcriptional regulator [Saccharothrix variisporea]RKT72986.1 DNA-binding MarR family transcriptional regulator [Saccharothrix variisporea]